MCIAKKLIGKPVMIRTESAGVHYGILVDAEQQDKTTTVELTQARRVYQWTGAFTLSALAKNGSTRTDSKLSVPVGCIVLNAIEVIVMENGWDNLNNIPDYSAQG